MRNTAQSAMNTANGFYEGITSATVGRMPLPAPSVEYDVDFRCQ
jgi:hypothetical protein